MRLVRRRSRRRAAARVRLCESSVGFDPNEFARSRSSPPLAEGSNSPEGSMPLRSAADRTEIARKCGGPKPPARGGPQLWQACVRSAGFAPRRARVAVGRTASIPPGIGSPQPPPGGGLQLAERLDAPPLGCGLNRPTRLCTAALPAQPPRLSVHRRPTRQNGKSCPQARHALLPPSANGMCGRRPSATLRLLKKRRSVIPCRSQRP